MRAHLRLKIYKSQTPINLVNSEPPSKNRYKYNRNGWSSVDEVDWTVGSRYSTIFAFFLHSPGACNPYEVRSTFD